MDTVTVLNNISNLRTSKVDEDEFWSSYLENISLLSRSLGTFLVGKSDENWVLQKEFLQNESLENFKNEILQIGVSLAPRAISAVFSYEKLRIKELSAYSIVAVAIKGCEKVLLLVIEQSKKEEFSHLVLRTTLVRDVYENYLSNQNSSEVVEVSEDEELLHVLEILQVMLHEKDFSLSVRKIVDELSIRFHCSKVSIGWENEGYIKPLAISQVEQFDKSSHLVNSLVAVFEESADQDEEIFYPLDAEDSTLICNAHKNYLTENRCSALYSFPVRDEEEVVAVVTFEKNEGGLSEKSCEVIRVILNYMAPILKDIKYKDQNFFKRNIEDFKRNAPEFLGPKHSVKKVGLILLSILFLWMVFGKLDYKIEAVTNVKTDNISFLSAPFDGVVKDVFVKSGDEVKEKDKLLQFDIEELSFKVLEINAQINKYKREAEKARAKRALADMRISLAKQKQSESELKRLEYYLSQSTLKAPFDGIIVEGDKEELLGNPFSKGDTILQVANPKDLYGILKVSEEYVDEIEVGQIAELNLLSRPDEFFQVKLEKIIPVAEVDGTEGNFFTVIVSFEDKTQDWMRPGMSGVAKIEVGERSLLWILTHKISDFFYFYLWW